MSLSGSFFRLAVKRKQEGSEGRKKCWREGGGPPRTEAGWAGLSLQRAGREGGGAARVGGAETRA